MAAGLIFNIVISVVGALFIIVGAYGWVQEPSVADPDDTLWGYAVASDPDDLLARVGALFDAVRKLEMLAGYCYTQLTDTYQEANGLLTADRTPKIPLPEIREMNEDGT